ncbi:unnamed protein product [Symbiodinium natans]|uniref:Uncharacterized protein n=1 Tax=Symbiodinium natans TaxID=878477 RepID=A0A812NFD7_9DINO|nr:unnamed protein product [Symbiodinium natans]
MAGNVPRQCREVMWAGAELMFILRAATFRCDAQHERLVAPAKALRGKVIQLALQAQVARPGPQLKIDAPKPGLLAIQKGQSWHDIEDEQEEDEAVPEDWEVVPAKEKRRPKEQAPPAAGGRQVGKVAGLIEDFCQRRELDNWVRLELQKIPAPEVGRVLHRLSCRMQDDPHVNLRALIAVERANSAQGHRRLDPSQCTQLQEWIQTLQLADVQRNEMFGVLSDGFTWAEFLHLRNQANFAKKCREGAWDKPVRAACGIMTSYRVDQYRHQVASFAIKFRLGQTAEKQLTDIGPKLGAQFMESWSGDRNARKQNKVGQDMERLNREIKELYLKELQMRDRSKWNARSMAPLEHPAA